ncbi:MAG: SHD1 domain-containing protein, partial [Planctomycetota bacterium]
MSVDSSPVRTWSSPDGKFKREGRLVEILGDRVKLEMTDGKSTIAQAAKLSPADQKFIAAERARMEANSDSPFMDEDSADSGKSASRGTGDTESDGGARSERDSRSADNES